MLNACSCSTGTCSFREVFNNGVGITMGRVLVLCVTFLAIFLTGVIDVPLAAQSSATGDAAHPLDPALKIAREGLEHIDAKVKDYTCTIVKRERIDGVLGDIQFLSAKVRHHGKTNKQDNPFSVYLKF